MQVEILKDAGTFGAIAVIILMTFVALIAGSTMYFRLPYNARLLSPIILSVVMHVLIMAYRVLHGNYLALDENVWHRQALAVGEAIRGNAPLDDGALTSGKEGYPWLIGFLYALAGPVPLVAIVLNVLLYTLLIPILSLITSIAAAEMKLNEDTAKRATIFAAYFLALNPIIAFWSPRLLREIISMFLIATAVLCLVFFLKKKKAIYLIGVVLIAVMMTTVREQIGVGLGASLLMGIVVVQSLKIKGKIARTGFVVPIFAGLFFATWKLVDLSVEQTAQNNAALSQATSAFSDSESIQSADSIVDIILFNLPRVLFGPFIHELNFSYVMILAAVSNGFWLGAIVLATKGLSRVKKFPERPLCPTEIVDKNYQTVLVLIVVLLTFCVMLSITAGNYGLVIRMRLMPFVVLIPLAGLGYALNVERRRMQFSPSSVKPRSPSHLQI